MNYRGLSRKSSKLCQHSLNWKHHYQTLHGSSLPNHYQGLNRKNSKLSHTSHGSYLLTPAALLPNQTGHSTMLTIKRAIRRWKTVILFIVSHTMLVLNAHPPSLPLESHRIK